MEAQGQEKGQRPRDRWAHAYVVRRPQRPPRAAFAVSLPPPGQARKRAEKHGGAQRASAARPSPAARLPAPQTAFLPLYGSQPLGTTWQAHPMTPRDVTHTCRPLLCPGLERLRDEVGKETVEAPSDRKGNEKGTTALPWGGRPTGKTCLPLTEITRGFPGKTGMEVLLTSHLKRQNTSEHTCSP